MILKVFFKYSYAILRAKKSTETKFFRNWTLSYLVCLENANCLSLNMAVYVVQLFFYSWIKKLLFTKHLWSYTRGPITRSKLVSSLGLVLICFNFRTWLLVIIPTKGWDPNRRWSNPRLPTGLSLCARTSYSGLVTEVRGPSGRRSLLQETVNCQTSKHLTLWFFRFLDKCLWPELQQKLIRHWQTQLAIDFLCQFCNFLDLAVVERELIIVHIGPFQSYLYLITRLNTL